MSEETHLGLRIGEKILGTLIIVMGLLTVNMTYTDPPEGVIKSFFNIFITAGFMLVFVGFLLLLAKTE